MSKVIHLTSQNTDAWNIFVDQSPQATPYHYSQWLNAIEAAYGHQPSGFISINEEGSVEGLLPIVNFKGLKQTKQYCSLPFCDVGGAVSIEASISNALISEAIGASPKNQVELRERDSKPLPESQLESYPSAKVSMLAELPEGSETLLKSYKPKLRSQIKKAQKNGLVSKLVHDASLIDDFYEIISRNMRDLGSPVHSKKFFENIMAQYGDKAATAVIYLEEAPTAAGLILMTPHNACIPWASSLREYNKLAPNMLLYWTFLAHVSDKGIPVFDFGRSTINQGTYRFKKQWGAQPWLLKWHQAEGNYQSNQNAIEDTVSSDSKLRELIEVAWQKMPLQLTNAIGPKIRKHISL